MAVNALQRKVTATSNINGGTDSAVSVNVYTRTAHHLAPMGQGGTAKIANANARKYLLSAPSTR